MIDFYAGSNHAGTLRRQSSLEQNVLPNERTGARYVAVLLFAAIAGCSTMSPDRQPAEDPSEAFARHAVAMVGQPYRYGGERPGGFDCSGLVNYAASRIGTRLPRTTSELVHVGQPVDRSKLRRGDLLFFHGSDRRKPDHVAIYLGDDRFVHAPETGRVVSVDDLSDAYYRRNYWQARRVSF